MLVGDRHYELSEIARLSRDAGWEWLGGDTNLCPRCSVSIGFIRRGQLQSMADKQDEHRADLELNEAFHRRLSSYRTTVTECLHEAKQHQSHDPMRAMICLEKAMQAIFDHESECWFEPSLLGRIAQRLETINRLTVCLKRTGRLSEIAPLTDRYFRLFPHDLKPASSKAILRRAERARSHGPSG